LKGEPASSGGYQKILGKIFVSPQEKNEKKSSQGRTCLSISQKEGKKGDFGRYQEGVVNQAEKNFEAKGKWSRKLRKGATLDQEGKE